MQLKDLTPNDKNPRTITEEKKAQLKKALDKFGSLDGFVFNRKSKTLVSGHQRKSVLDSDSQITITKKFSKPTKTGTVAEGYVEIGGDRFPYREVYWSSEMEKAGTIAANKGAGEWDLPQLGEWLKELSDFDLDFDMGLTMFDDDEFKSYLPSSSDVANTSKEIDIDGITTLQHECPKCGFTFGSAKK